MKRSKIWQVPDVEFRKLVADSTSFSEVLRRIGLQVYGGSLKLLQKRIARLQIDTSHFTSNQPRLNPQNKIPLQEILVEHSPYPRIHLKPRLIERGLLENRCAICGLSPEWQGQELVLALDHINGVKDDHRLENLRILCPNCHSQTDTFASRNFIKRKQQEGIPVNNSTKTSYLDEHKKSLATLQIPLEEIFAANSKRGSETLKKRLIRGNFIPYECAICGRLPEWQGQELVLVLDHINGVHDDNRLENLRFLCPNCNSQTETFAGKHLPKPKKERFCKGCGARITRYSKSGFCVSCANHNQRTVERPSREELEQLVEAHGYCAVGRMFGVSDNAIRKWLRGIPAAASSNRWRL